MTQAQWKQDLKSPWLRGVLGIVAVTLVVNIGLISFAFIDRPNLVVKDYYEQGKEYFHHAQAELDAARQLGFRLHLLPPATPRQGEVQTYRLYVVDHQGKPWSADSATLFAYRPNDASQDFRQILQLSDVGTYAADVSFPLPGNWDLIAQIYVDNKKLDIAQRIFVAKP